MKSRIACFVTLIAAVNAANAAGATLTVTTTSDSLTADGQCSLREAIAAVNTPGSIGDCAMADDIANTIVLGPHEYDLTIHPTGMDDQTTGDLNVTGTTPLTIQGAGVGSTTISAATLQDRILHVASGTTVTIKDLTITGGHAPNGAAGANGANVPIPVTPTAGGLGAPGGGIRNEGTLTLQDVAVTNNTAGSGGLGGVGQPGASEPNVDGKAGGAGGAGGGIYNDSPGSLTLTDATVSGNIAGNGGTGGTGGELGSTVVGGKGGDGGCCGDGGGVDNVGGQVIITGSTFAGNHAGAGGSGGQGEQPQSGIGGAGGQGQGGSSGGAIATSGATAAVSITNSTLSGNFSGVGGNGGNGGLTTDTPIIDWQSGGGAGNGSAGGGLFVSGGATGTLTNVTVAGNQVGGPGSPGAVGSTPSCTGPNCGHPLPGAPGNPAFGGGVYDSTTPATTLSNTLLASNELGNCAGNIIDGGHDVSFGVSDCPGNGFNRGDPELGALQDNGGPTPTQALGAGSAAIDQVPTTGAGCPSTDQRGASRPSGAACDTGAYELSRPVVTVPTSTAITRAGATVHDSVTPNQSSVSVVFDYGTTTSYGSSTAARVLIGGFAAQPVAATLTQLKPGATYHFRVVATSADGTTTSSDATFKTAPALPSVPRLTQLRVKLLKAGRAGARITYSDSEAAKTKIVVRRCVKRPRHGHGCKKFRNIGTLTHADVAGANSITLHHKLGRRTLVPARYQLRLTPSLGHLVGRTVSTAFVL